MIRKTLCTLAAGAVLAAPTAAGAQLLFSFEDGLQGWGPTNFFSGPDEPIVQAATTGATDGSTSLEIIHLARNAFSWNGGVTMGSDPGDALAAQFSAIQNAAANPSAWSITFDVTMDPALVGNDATFYNITFALNSSAGFAQVDNVFEVGEAELAGTDLVQETVEIPLTSFSALPGPDNTFTQFFIAQNQNGARDNASIFIDNIRLVPEPASLALLGLGALAIGLRRRTA